MSPTKLAVAEAEIDLKCDVARKAGDLAAMQQAMAERTALHRAYYGTASVASGHVANAPLRGAAPRRHITPLSSGCASAPRSRNRTCEVWPEADVEDTDLEAVILDLLEGQYKDHPHRCLQYCRKVVGGRRIRRHSPRAAPPLRPPASRHSIFLAGLRGPA
jgi:hypothetical protein